MNKKGFISIYGIMLLSICMGFTSMLYVKAKSVKVENEKLAYAELYAIQQAKQSLDSYEEEVEEAFEDDEEVDESENIETLDGETMIEPKNLYYEGYDIVMIFELDTCNIQIYRNGQLRIHSQLRFDSNNHKIISYIYL